MSFRRQGVPPAPEPPIHRTGTPGRAGAPGVVGRLPGGMVARGVRIAMVLSVAVGAGLFGVSASPSPAGATTSARPSLTLVSQSPWVTPGQDFAVSVSLGGRTLPAGTQLHLTLYNELTARSTFTATVVSGSPTGGVLDTADPVAVPAGVAVASATVPVGPVGDTAAGAGFDLHCEPGSCSGVYPVEVSLVQSGGSVLGRLLTYLTYDESDVTAGAGASSPQALRVAVVFPFDPPVASRPAGGAARTLTALETLTAQLTASPVPETLVLYGRTAQLLAAGGGRGGRAALASLAGLSSGAAQQLPTPSYVPVDAGALAGAGLTGEVQVQFERGDGVLAQWHVHAHGGTFISPTTVGSSLAAALAPIARGQGVSPRALRVVVPDTALAPVPADPLTYSQPFSLNLGGTSVTAAAADGGLTAHFAAASGDPVLAANQLLADLAFIHDERPGVTYPRGVVAVPPAGWVPSPAFTDALLRGLSQNPVVEPVTLDSFFATVPPHTPVTSGTRRLANGGPGPATPLTVRRAIAVERLRLSGFDSAVAGPAPVTTVLGDALLAAESSALSSARQLAGVDGAERLLDQQLSLVQLAAERTITLTARSAPIPVTVLSSAPYTLHAVLTLISDRFIFPPPGSSRRMVIDRATNPVRIQAVARTTGDLPVGVTLTSPHFGLVIASAQLTVRSTATSVVGVVLTVLALAVLLAWWARTWRRGRRRDRARA